MEEMPPDLVEKIKKFDKYVGRIESSNSVIKTRYQDIINIIDKEDERLFSISKF